MTAVESDAVQKVRRMKDAKPPILLTGFDAFGDNKSNPSELLIADLAASLPRAIALPLPTSFAEAGRLAIAAIERHDPCAVVMFGLAATELSIRLEFIARNEITADQPDNNGQIRLGERIDDDGPDLYTTTLPLNSIMRMLRADGHEFTTSDNAGGYVCNALFYSVQHFLAESGRSTPAGFVHIPASPPVTTSARAIVAFIDGACP